MALPDDLFFFFFFFYMHLSFCSLIFHSVWLSLSPPPPLDFSPLVFLAILLNHSVSASRLSHSISPLLLSVTLDQSAPPFLSSTLSAPTSVSAFLFSVSIFLSVCPLLSVIGRRASDWEHMKDLNEHREKTLRITLSCSPLSHFSCFFWSSWSYFTVVAIVRLHVFLLGSPG